MGTPIPPIIGPPPANAGDPCNSCWGTGKAFGDVQTPDYVIATASGIQKSEFWEPFAGEPLDGDYRLDQSATQACRYIYDDGSVVIILSLGLALGLISARRNVVTDLFIAGGSVVCDIQYFNDPLAYFTGGSVFITIPVV